MSKQNYITYRLDAILEGVEAFKNNVVGGDNPYNEHEEKHWLWIKGWIQAALNAKRTEGGIEKESK